MECTFDVRVRPQDDPPMPFTTLFALQPGGTDTADDAPFVDICGQHFGEAGQAAARALIETMREHGEPLWLQSRAPRDGWPVWEGTYGTDGIEIASAIADFLAALSPELAGDVEGDYDEDPWGFRYAVANGRVEFEEGFNAADEFGEDAYGEDEEE